MKEPLESYRATQSSVINNGTRAEDEGDGERASSLFTLKLTLLHSQNKLKTLWGEENQSRQPREKK